MQTGLQLIIYPCVQVGNSRKYSQFCVIFSSFGIASTTIFADLAIMRDVFAMNDNYLQMHLKRNYVQ